MSHMQKLIILITILGLLLVTKDEARAAIINSGDLIKASQPTVYYYGANGKRYVFPTEKTYFSWFSNFNNIKILSDGELSLIPIGGNVTYRPGVRLLKITTNPKVYAVDAHGTLRHITSETIVSILYGDYWNRQVDDLPDTFFTDYVVGNPIATPSDYNPITATQIAKNIDIDRSSSTIDRTPSGVVAEYLTCMTSNEKTTYDEDFNIRSVDENDLGKAPAAGPDYLCDFSSDEPSGLKIYNTLRFLKNISFSHPLPFTNGETIYDFLRLKSLPTDLQDAASTTHVLIGLMRGCDVSSMGLNNIFFYRQNPKTELAFHDILSGTMTRIYPVVSQSKECANADLPIDSPMFLNGRVQNPIYPAVLIVHESQHAIGDKLHTDPTGSDKTIQEMGAWAAQFYFDAWVSLYSTNVDSNTKELARNDAHDVLSTRFSENRCPTDASLRFTVNQISPGTCP